MNTKLYASRRVMVTLAGLAAVVSMIVVLRVSGTHESHADSDHAHGTAAAQTSKQLALHDGCARCDPEGSRPSAQRAVRRRHPRVRRPIERHMITMAEMLSSGIVRRFPARFR